MGWDPSLSYWLLTALGAGGAAAVGITRPWRFWQARRYCPQCKQVLPRWGLWGWKDGWVCRHCDCQSGG